MSDNSEIAKSFLSHNSRDKPAVEVIQGLLERGDLQRGERPIPCWFDKDDLRSTGTWMSQLEDAVATCGSAIVFYGAGLRRGQTWDSGLRSQEVSGTLTFVV
jgi:hypothetical protein